MSFKRLATTLAIGSFITAGLVTVASPASADLSQCGTGQGCMWTNLNYMDNYSAFVSNLNLNASRNAVTSVANMGYSGSYSVARFYDDLNYQGANIAMYNPIDGRQSRDPDLTNGIVGNGSNWDNRIESGIFRNS